MAASSPVEAAQSSLGKYTLIEKIGEGYLGSVYRGFDQDLGLPVVVRILCDGIKWDARLEDDFRRECRAVSAFRHPNIAQIFEVGREGQSHYIAMESLGSGTLQNLIGQNSAVPVETKLSIMVQVAEGLSYAHRKGILHRDLGPGKIHLTPDGNVKIRDFAFAHVLMKHLPHPAVRFGAPIYLCPEQIQHTDCDARSDIFSAGTIFYELMTRFHPFHDRDSNKALDNILSENQIPTFEKFPDAPPGIWTILKSCLARHPEDRFRSAEELVDACRELLKSLREDTQLMLGELYGSLSPLRKAAAQPKASAKTRALLEEIENLVRGKKRVEYASLDRLMTMLMEEYPAIQAASDGLPALDSICPQLPPEEEGAAIEVKTGPQPPEPESASEKQPGLPGMAKMTEEAPVQHSEANPELFYVSLAPKETKPPGGDPDASRTESANNTDASQKENTAEASAKSEPLSGASANLTIPADQGSSPSDSTYVRQTPSRRRKIPSPTYRMAVILLSLLVMATAGYIVMLTGASTPIRKGWEMIYVPAKSKIIDVFAPGSRKQTSGGPSDETSKQGSKAEQNSAEVLLKEARALAAQNRIEESKVLIRRILETAPAYQPALAALAELDAASAGAPGGPATDPPVEESIGRISWLINSGRLQTAKSEIDRLQQTHPDAPEIPGLRKKWQAAYSRQVQDQFRKDQEQQKSISRQKEEEWNRRLADLLARGNYSEAAGTLSLWLAQNPGSGRAQDLNAQVLEIQRQVRIYNSALAENRYPEALNAVSNAEKLNPADPNLAEMRRQAEARKAAARAVLTVHRLGTKAALLLDGRPIGKDGEVEGESIPIGSHTLTIESGGVPLTFRIQEYSEGQRVALVYDLLKQTVRPMAESDRDLIARRKSLEEVERITLEHDHGVFRGSCRGVLSLDSLDVAFSPSSGSHGFRIPFKLLKLKVQGKSASILYISDNTHFQTFKFQNEQTAEKFRQRWDELKALLR